MSNQNKAKVRGIGKREKGTGRDAEPRPEKLGRSFSLRPFSLQGRLAALVVADAESVHPRAEENLAIADPPGAGGADDRLNGFVLQLIGNHHLDLHLGEKIDRV